ncbi:AzlD domain-containing protein [Corynebacterium sp. H78]|uniref:AzlD domain-containing protein n=1 Tax=Corynebacterium sp. H78 TaxID=3133417 RepID=UPI0030A40FBA
MSIWVSVGIMFAITFALRAAPLVLVRGELTNARLRAFLAFSPYAVLTAMTVPAVIHSTSLWYSGLAALLVAVLLAWRNFGLFTVAIGAALTVWVVELWA